MVTTSTTNILGFYLVSFINTDQLLWTKGLCFVVKNTAKQALASTQKHIRKKFCVSYLLSLVCPPDPYGQDHGRDGVQHEALH